MQLSHIRQMLIRNYALAATCAANETGESNGK
jgi:hypothetical protein